MCSIRVTPSSDSMEASAGLQYGQLDLPGDSLEHLVTEVEVPKHTLDVVEVLT
jgi:hypothetical protein